MHFPRAPLQDPESFSHLFTRTHLIIFRFIYGLHGGPIEEVEDLTSDTYSRAWKSRRSFSGNDQDALRWLFTIARHLVIDAHRKKKTHLEGSVQKLDGIILDVMFHSPQKSPEEQADLNEQFTHMWKLLQGLPQQRREMLVLRFIVGWQVKQIANYLQMEENTISVYIQRSLEEIRNNWK